MLLGAALLAIVAAQAPAPPAAAPDAPPKDADVDAAVVSPSATPPRGVEPGLRFDVPFLLLATRPSSSVETTATPWTGARLGFVTTDDRPLFFGGDGALYVGGWESGGTEAVSAWRLLSAVELRGLVGARYLMENTSASAFAFAGATGGGGASAMKVYDDERMRPVLTIGGRVGVGVEARVRFGLVRVELGVGMRDLRPETSAACAAGFAF